MFYLKLQSVTFLVKNDLKSIFEQLHNQPMLKNIAFSPIHNGKLIIMFSSLSGMGRFSQEIRAWHCVITSYYMG